MKEENEKWNRYFGIDKTVIPASSTNSPFNGFSTGSQEDSDNEVDEDPLLTKDYKDNMLKFYSTENVAIAPYDAQIMILDIINDPWVTPHFPLTNSSARKKFKHIFIIVGDEPSICKLKGDITKENENNDRHKSRSRYCGWRIFFQRLDSRKGCPYAIYE